MIKRIVLENAIHAIYIPENLEIRQGVEFITDARDEFQIGLIGREEGERVPLHKHLGQRRVLSGTSECLYVREGICSVTIQSLDGKESIDILCHKGDFLLLLRGSHSVHFIENTSLIEIKQGPFSALKDKELID